jgi:hypothetical protein
MDTLIDEQKINQQSFVRKFSIFGVILCLLILDLTKVRKDGNYIIIGDTAVELFTLFLLFMLALGLVALLRPMETKKYMQH